MDTFRATILLGSLSEKMGYHPKASNLNSWRIRNGDDEGWIAIQDLAGMSTIVVARFPVCQVPEERRGSFFRQLLRTNMSMAGLGALAIGQDGLGVWSHSVCDLRYVDDPNAFSNAVNLAAALARIARDDVARFL